MCPFDVRVTTLVRSKANAELSLIQAGSKSNALLSPPASVHDAKSAQGAYLSGTVEWWRWKIETDLKSSREFKDLGVADYRTKAAKELRDRRLEGKSICFLHQAIRYRGKANYREALYLGYGTAVETLVSGHIRDLATVLTAFVTMAGAFASRRLGNALWSEFLQNLEAKRSFTVSPTQLWS